MGKGKRLNLLKYYFEDNTPNKSKKSREDLVVMVQLALNERNKVTDEMKKMKKPSGHDFSLTCVNSYVDPDTDST